jgi:Ni/Co efflux regulator RcnB
MEKAAMKKIFLAATALTLFATAPAFAPGQQAQAQSYSKDHTATHKVKKAKVQKTQTHKRVVRNGSPYSTDPAHDAYVNGTYVGSDPDPRIRWQLKREYCEESVDGCGAP